MSSKLFEIFLVSITFIIRKHHKEKLFAIPYSTKFRYHLFSLDIILGSRVSWFSNIKLAFIEMNR